MKPESPRDLETKIKELLRDHKGVDVVLAVGYTIGGSEQTSLIISKDPAACRRLCRTLWARLQNEPSPVSKSPEPDEPDED